MQSLYYLVSLSAGLLGGGNKGLQTNAGVFPHTEECLIEFTKIYLEASKKMDVLASWQAAEEWLYKYKILQTNNKIDYNILEFAYRLKDPWTSALKGKKVLVISPFAEEMVRQYKSEIRHLLFSNQEFLPDFEITAIKSVNTAGKNSESSGYRSWSEALSFMKAQITKEDFDVALLGCGAYAFPLGAFIKDLGKQAITVCGALQTYFGIYGGRTEHLPERNQYWIRPDMSTRPLGFEAIENSAYW